MRDDERSLVSFFSEKTLSTMFTLAWLLALFVVLIWPKGEIFEYLRDQSTPFAFLCTFVCVLLMISYLNLRWGGGEFFKEDDFYLLSSERFKSFEEERNFFTYGLIGFLLHVCLLILLALPLLIASSAVSGIGIQAFAKATSVLFGSALLCRMFGFMIYLLCRYNWIAFNVVRLFFILFFFVSAVFAPFANPIAMIYFLHKHEQILAHYPLNAYLLHMIVVAVTILLLSSAIQSIIGRRMKVGEST